MKKKIYFAIFLTEMVGCTISCKNQLITPANAPVQTLLMPSAQGGNYLVNALSDGNTYRYVGDLTSAKLNIPLGVYRSGSDNKGAVSVYISANADTISKLILGNRLTGTSLLPADQYTLPSSTKLDDGQEVSQFNLSVSLPFLLTNPGKVYAIGVGIASPDRKVSATLGTTIVVIDTKFLVPLASFSAVVNAGNKKQYSFINNSLYANNFTWDFGDGSPTVNDQAPIHVYANSGTFLVTLTAKGALGDQNKAVKSVQVIVQ